MSQVGTTSIFLQRIRKATQEEEMDEEHSNKLREMFSSTRTTKRRWRELHTRKYYIGVKASNQVEKERERERDYKTKEKSLTYAPVPQLGPDYMFLSALTSWETCPMYIQFDAPGICLRFVYYLNFVCGHLVVAQMFEYDRFLVPFFFKQKCFNQHAHEPSEKGRRGPGELVQNGDLKII